MKQLLKHNLKKAILLLIMVALSLATSLTGLQGVQAEEEKQLRIVTSFYPMYALTKTLVGDLHDVRMINSANGIHGFEPSVKDVAAIQESDIFIYHSNILESWAKKLMGNLKASGVEVVEASKGLEMEKVPGLENLGKIKGMKEESSYDPHTWLDPVEAADEIQLIADALSKIDPDNESTYQERAKAFKEEADSLVSEYQDKFNALSNKTFVTQHTAFSYLARRFGLEQLGIAGVSSDIEPGSKKMIEVQKFIQDHAIKTIFVEPNVSPKSAETIAQATGVDVQQMSPLESDPQNDKTFLENLRQVLETLYEGLK